MSKLRGKYGKGYSSNDLQEAVKKVLRDGWSVYRCSKEFSIPYNTLKDRLKVCADPSDSALVKMGRPFFLSKEEETKLVKYTIDMQELGFGLSASDVRHYAYQLASCRPNGNPFGQETDKAGWDWWCSFKKRYGLSLRQPENLSYQRAAAATRSNLNDFYDVLESVFRKTGLDKKPNQVWNLDETGFSLVTKPNKIVSPKGTKRVHLQTTAEKGETTTVLLAVNAMGQNVPPMFIFKGSRVTENVKETAPPLSQVAVSKNGWINSDLFLDFLKHFVNHIPPFLCVTT